MGIVLKDLMVLDFFKDFQIIAGRKGLNREIQGVAVMDAPDSLRWSKGRELIMTSGYSIFKEPGCIKAAFDEGCLQRSAALMIKEGRYFDKIPQEVVDECEAHDFPLIRMPYEVPYMDVMNQVNISVLNRTIRRFRIEDSNALQFSTLTYKEQKIKKILQAVEIEMQFPSFVYDISEKKSYYSSAGFRRATDSFGLKEEDYYNPPAECTECVLCDYIHMKRYRLIHEEDPSGPRISWVLIPITIASEVKAYFVVMESKELLDYFDEYSIRIAFLMLQGVYEQITVMQRLGNTGFENLVLLILNSEEENPGELLSQAPQQGISANASFVCVRFCQKNAALSARKNRNSFINVFHNCRLSENGRFAFIDENDGIILLEVNEEAGINKDFLKESLLDFRKKTAEKCPGMDLAFGAWFRARRLSELRRTAEKLGKTIEIGKKAFPQDPIWDYETLKPLTWLKIPPDELDETLRQYRPYMKSSKDRELLKTLKIYLENNMNYSATAEKMYIHINTVRKRIDKIHSLLHIEWDDYMARLKAEIILQYLAMEGDLQT